METRSGTRRASEIHKYYESVDVYDDEGNESETEDIVEIQLDESDNEIEQMETDEQESDKSASESLVQVPKNKRTESYLRGKNNYKWSLNPPETQDKRSNTQYFGGPKGRAAMVKTPLESWSVFFDDEILNIIVKHTNEEIDREITRLTDNDITLRSHHKHTDLTELKAVIGLLYFAGLQKMNGTDAGSLWSHYGMSLFRTTMSLLRFNFLITCIRFDDKNTRAERKANDPLVCIREVWDKFIANCMSNYEPDSKCTIGEQLFSFRGKCAFRMYLPRKPDRYGLKIIALNDAASHYLYNAIPYCGTHFITDKNPTESVPSYFVRKLCEPIYHTGRNITCDKRFTSVPMCDEMLKKYNTTMVGTICKNKSEIPYLFKTVPSDGAKIRFAYNDRKILVSYNPEAKKIVLLLSSYHSNGKIDNETEEPEIVQLHKETKSGTDSFDKKCRDFTVARKTFRWSMRFFYGMLDQANVNSFIVYSLLESNNLIRRNNFILDLCMALIRPFLLLRLTQSTLQAGLRRQIENFLERKDIPEDHDPFYIIAENKMPKQKRCGFCPSTSDRKTSYKCLRCETPMCKQHIAKICIECSIELSS